MTWKIDDAGSTAGQQWGAGRMPMLKVMQFGRIIARTKVDTREIDDDVREMADKIMRRERRRNARIAGPGYYDLVIVENGKEVDSEVAVA